MEIEFTQQSDLLDAKGRLISGGWSRSMLLDYDRSVIPVWRRMWRLKEHDSYTFGNDRVQVTVTIADNGYMGLVSATVAKLDVPSTKTTSKLIPFPLGRLGLPRSTADGDILYRSDEVSTDFCKSPGKRYVRMRMEHFDDVRPLYINVTLEQPPADSLCAALPFDQSECFYYTQKLHFDRVYGTVVYGADSFELREDECRGSLDWGRGVIPRGDRSLQCSACGWSDGQTIGINLGCGTGDRSDAGENIVFYGGTGYKFAGVEISHGADILKPWHMVSTDKRLELSFEPVIEMRTAPSIWGMLSAVSHRIYGRYSGSVNLGGGVTVSLDGVTGYIDAVYGKGREML